MSQTERDTHGVAVAGLHEAIRRMAARTLGQPGPLGVAEFRRVERLMRIAIAVAGAGEHTVYVETHAAPTGSEPGALVEPHSVELAGLLADRASGHLPGALRGDPEALRALVQEAERILETEDVQLG
jgi:hypothetical protein